MQLVEWMKKTKHTQTDVALGVGLSKSRVCRICKGESPRLCEVMAIEDFTHRKVTAKDWIDRLRGKHG